MYMLLDRMFHQLVLSLTFVLVAVQLIEAHGTVHEPPARQSRWRYDKSAIANYDDKQLFCGGHWVQWGVNGGKCGVCGDNYSNPPPRAHELGGKYGDGIIVRQYKRALDICVKVEISANHKGYFKFDLCNVDHSRETEECFQPLLMTNGEEEYKLPTTKAGWFDVCLKLPEDLVCEHCVLRWTYVAGNNWGKCPNGGGAVGCGPQEHFRACSDICIT